MTAQQTKVITAITEQLDADRWAASQAARDVAQMDAVSVLYAVQIKISEGRIAEARAMVEAYRASQRSN